LFSATLKAKSIIGHSDFDIVVSPWYNGYKIRIRSFAVDMMWQQQFVTTYQEIISGEPDILNLRFEEALHNLVYRQNKE